MLMKKTPQGTLFATTYSEKEAIGLFFGIYNKKNVACVEYSDGRLKILLNDDALDDIDIIHTDASWKERK